MSATTNQRMVSVSRSGSVAFQAWAASVALHLLVLTVFGVVRFSQLRTKVRQGPAPTTKLSRRNEFSQAARIMSKPKVRKTRSERSLLPAGPTLDFVKPISQDPEDLTGSSVSQSALLLSAGLDLPHRAEFFGSQTEQRKVCYVVDCSGSMRGIFRQVRKKLAESIMDLQPDQYFCVIFFGGDKLFEFGEGRLLRAAQRTKVAACDFIDSVRPAGQTNALAAMERAMQIRDSQGDGPSIIYFLTDGFELTTQDAHIFSQKIASLRRLFAPTARINTIGFWTQDDDREILEAIARQSGGEFVFVDGGT